MSAPGMRRRRSIKLLLSAALFVPGALALPACAQTPPYISKDITFDGPHGITLAGTLTTPPGAGSFPAVVLIAGSGPHDRDETRQGQKKPFAILADALTRRGVAVLRMDKRGVGKSTGDFNSAMVEDFAADAEADVQYLRSLAFINPKKVGLVGHSEGGGIAPIVAAKDRDISFIVLMAGPGQSGEDIIIEQQRLLSREPDPDKAEIVRRNLLEILRTTPDLDQAKQKMSAALAAAGTGTQNPEVFIGEQITPYLQAVLTYDPIQLLQQVRCPVLAINGSLDRIVPPRENLAAIKNALARNSDATVMELPGLNHEFQTATTGYPDEYSKIEETIAPVAVSIIGDWVVRHVE